MASYRGMDEGGEIQNNNTVEAVQCRRENAEWMQSASYMAAHSVQSRVPWRFPMD